MTVISGLVSNQANALGDGPSGRAGEHARAHAAYLTGAHPDRTSVCLGISADQIAAFPEVDYLVVCAGQFDILAEIVTEDDEHLLEVINRKIRSLPSVRSTETFVYLKLRKQIYTWGTR